MNELVETRPGIWKLVAGPHAIRTMLMTFIARLAERDAVFVLDGGNQFNAYLIARALRGQSALLERITIARMFTCHQVLASLEKAASLPSPFIVLDLLHTFYDETIPFHERRKLVECCIPHLERLSSQAGGAISVHPPAVVTPEAETLFAILSAAAPELWTQDMPSQFNSLGGFSNGPHLANRLDAGSAGGAIGFTLVALAVNYLTTLLALVFFIFSLALIGPALNAYISSFAGKHQGTVMGLNCAMTSLGRVVGPLWGGYIYDIDIEYPFFSGAATFLLGLLVSFIGLRKRNHRENDEENP